MLEPNGTIKLYAGEHFAIRVPLRVSTAVNLGSAELSISLAPDGDRATGEGVTLLARLGAAHVLLGRGDQTLVLHGVVAEIPKHQLGAAHAADYGIRLGSGTTVNIGTPDEQFIDTKALANTLSALHLQLVESPKR